MPASLSTVSAAALLVLSHPAFGASQEVEVRVLNDHLQVSAPALHFITGKPLDQLKNGLSIAYDIQISILSDGRQTVLHRSFDRFVLSYDLWEERFSIVRLRSSGASASHLTASAAEAWCVNRFALPMTGLPQDRPLWVRIDVRANEGRDRRSGTAPDGSEDQPFSLSNLIQIFSQPVRPRSGSAMQWRAESTAFQLATLRRATH